MYACLYILEIWNVKLYDYPELILIFYRLVTFKNLLNTLSSQDQGYYGGPIGSHMRAFDWCHNQRPWMTLKGHYALCFNKQVCQSLALHHVDVDLEVDEQLVSIIISYSCQLDNVWQ